MENSLITNRRLERLAILKEELLFLLKEAPLFVARVTVPIFIRSLIAFGVFVWWPVVPSLLWKWTPTMDLSSISMQIGDRVTWLVETPGVGTCYCAVALVGLVWRIIRVTLNSPLGAS
jgi:hypothetical protein